MKEKRQSGHPHHKGGGMTEFESQHWEKKIDDVTYASTRYNPSEMNQVGEYKEMVDKQAAYAKKHKAEH
jgi:hypothetical protein